jgi:predicted RNA-binding Zn ribbon-like protein
MRLDGGHLALDFLNTLGGEVGGEPPSPWDEHFRDYDDVVTWGVRVGALEEAVGERVLTAARRDPDQAARALEEALELRRLIDAVLRPLSDRELPAPADLERLRDAEVAALARAELVEREDGTFHWRWHDGDDLHTQLHPYPHAALDLLMRAPLPRLKRCGRCRWLFIDASRNGSRRWCSMEECGSAVKQERFVERRRRRRLGAA